MLVLDRYFFTHQEVSAKPLKDNQKLQSPDIKISLNVERLENKQTVLVMCEIKTENPEEAHYLINLQALALINYTEADLQNFDAQIKATGESLMLGIMREKLFQLTASGPYPAIQLPINGE